MKKNSEINIYKQILERNIPRLLCCYNTDSMSDTIGYGDRLYWGWKVADFSNGTFQGGIHALAVSLCLGLFENKQFILNIIDNAVNAVRIMRAKNGSLVEAFPGESSFCVTAQVAFDILSAVKHLGNMLTIKQIDAYLEIIRPLIRFITCNTETHAIISNHLATAAAAIVLWNKLSGEKNMRYNDLLEIIYQNQSDEGWYREYEGADPGYQTLCITYLASILKETDDERLKKSLIRSVDFLKYFIHPDSTIGGLYGSRNTEVYYPGGMAALENISPDFMLIASCMEQGIVENQHIVPDAIDAGNFIPLLNSYAAAAFYYNNSLRKRKSLHVNPPYEENFEKDFTDAGIFIKSTNRYYAIINYKKGGTIKIIDKKNKKVVFEDGGIFGKLGKGIKFSTQQVNPVQTFDKKIIGCSFYKINEAYPSPYTFIILRLFSISIFRSLAVLNIFKQQIVAKLMTGKKKIDGRSDRKFIFLDNKILVEEEIIKPKNCSWIGHIGKAKAIHMASSGYVLKQDELRPQECELIEIRTVIT